MNKNRMASDFWEWLLKKKGRQKNWILIGFEGSRMEFSRTFYDEPVEKKTKIGFFSL